MEKFILFLPGGTMAGVFGAGVLTEFERMGIHKRFEAIYGISAGAINATYFACGRIGFASKVYWKYLPEGFVRRRRIPFALFHRFVLELFPGHIHKPIFNILDVDYLMHVAKNKTPLDVKALRKCPVPVYIKLIDIDSGKISYYDVRKAKDPYAMIQAAVTCVPFTCCGAMIDGKNYVDGGVAEQMGIKKIMKRHPGKKVLVIANMNTDRNSNLIKKVNKVTAAATRISVSKHVAKYFPEKEEGLLKEVEELKTMKNVMLILRPEHLGLKAYTKDKKELKRAFDEGRKMAAEFIETLK